MRPHHKWGDISLVVVSVCAALWWMYVMSGL